MGASQAADVRRAAPLTAALLVALLALSGCGEGTGAPGAAVATGDAESQREADEVVRDYADDLVHELPPPGSTRSSRIDARVPAVLDAWRATVTRELVSATGPSSDRRLLVRLTVDWEPSNTSDWGEPPSPARVARCYRVTPDPDDVDGPGGVDPDWRSVEAPCEGD
jgi:hypothetical protein